GFFFFFFQAEDGIRDFHVTGVQTCALPICAFVGDVIYLLGAENVDTDEFDTHVILHEWAHYFEKALSRTDTIGGMHQYADYLDKSEERRVGKECRCRRSLYQ